MGPIFYPMITILVMYVRPAALRCCRLPKNRFVFQEIATPHRKSMTSWRNGSASDSSLGIPEGYPFKSGRGQCFVLRKNFVYSFVSHPSNGCFDTWTPLPSEVCLDSTEFEEYGFSTWTHDRCPARRCRRWRSFLDCQLFTGGFGRCSCMDRRFSFLCT